MLYLQIDVTKNITKNERDVVKMVIDYEIIGKRIRAERVKQKLTQEDMAERAHINLARIIEIADILNVSPGYFLTGIEEEADDYLYKDFKMILEQSTAKQQKIIYRMAEVVLEEIKI